MASVNFYELFTKPIENQIKEYIMYGKSPLLKYGTYYYPFTWSPPMPPEALSKQNPEGILLLSQVLEKLDPTYTAEIVMKINGTKLYIKGTTTGDILCEMKLTSLTVEDILKVIPTPYKKKVFMYVVQDLGNKGYGVYYLQVVSESASQFSFEGYRNYKKENCFATKKEVMGYLGKTL